MLKVVNLNKKYPSFSLKDVSFELESGYILGFIGVNGAGKSTTIKSMLNIVKADSGIIEFFGKNIDEYELEIKQNIGVSLGAFEYYPRNKLKQITLAYKRFFKNWDDAKYYSYLKKFSLDENKRAKELSQGMKVKYSLALALSHGAKLFILDEPTSGLDPLAREELLDIFQEIVSDGEHSILFSTHVTSDLDKCADFILFIKDGEIIAHDTKDDLIEKHVLISGKSSDFSLKIKEKVISYKLSPYNFKALALKEKVKDLTCVEREVPNVEDLMLFYNKENNDESNAL